MRRELKIRRILHAAALLFGCLYGVFFHAGFSEIKTAGHELLIFVVSAITMVFSVSISVVVTKPFLWRWTVLGGMSVFGVGFPFVIRGLANGGLEDPLVIVGANLLIWGTGLGVADIWRMGRRGHERELPL